jgi:hypothetical protein
MIEASVLLFELKRVKERMTFIPFSFQRIPDSQSRCLSPCNNGRFKEKNRLPLVLLKL